MHAIDADLVRQLIENLNNLTAEEFLSDAPSRADEEAWGFNQPEREIAITTMAGNTPTTTTLRLGVGANRGATAYAQFSEAHFVYAIDSEIQRKVPVEPRAWRNRLLRELPAGARITAIAPVSPATRGEGERGEDERGQEHGERARRRDGERV